MADTPDQSLIQWALGGATALLTGAFKVIWTRQGEAEKRHAAEIRDIWNAITSNQASAQTSRERMLERLGEMPTKADLVRLEDKLTALLTPRHGSD